MEEQKTEEIHKSDEVQEHKPSGSRRDDNTVFIGKKGTMGYVLAVVLNSIMVLKKFV